MLIDRQIKAVRETLEQVIGEYARGHDHHTWNVAKCPLCQISRNCSDCPFFYYFNRSCGDLTLRYGSRSLEDIAGFLKSLLISLEEMR